jgi:hypothetical protein
VSIDNLIAKWESIASYRRKCYMSTSEREAEIINQAKAELADEIVDDLRKAKAGRL